MKPYLMVQWADGPVTVELEGRFTRGAMVALVSLLRTAMRQGGLRHL